MISRERYDFVYMPNELRERYDARLDSALKEVNAFRMKLAEEDLPHIVHVMKWKLIDGSVGTLEEDNGEEFLHAVAFDRNGRELEIKFHPWQIWKYRYNDGAWLRVADPRKRIEERIRRG